MEKEDLHIIQVLTSTKRALMDEDPIKLRELSDQTIHSACGIQDEGSLTIVVLIYSLSKLIERKQQMHIKNWNKFVKKFNSDLDLAIKAIKDNRKDKFESYVIMARKTLTSVSINIRPYIQEIIRKASINKASKLYEHGISLGRTADILGLTQWELTEYTGQRHEPIQHATIKVKQRVETALDFFS